MNYIQQNEESFKTNKKDKNRKKGKNLSKQYNPSHKRLIQVPVIKRNTSSGTTMKKKQICTSKHKSGRWSNPG